VNKSAITVNHKRVPLRKCGFSDHRRRLYSDSLIRPLVNRSGLDVR